MTLAFSTRGGGQWRWGGIVWNRGPLVPRPSELGGQSPACPPFLSHGGGFGTWIFGVPTRDPQEEAAPSVPPPSLDCVAGAWWPVLGESPVSSRPAPPILPSSPPPHPACPHPPKTNHQVRQPFILLYCEGWEKGRGLLLWQRAVVWEQYSQLLGTACWLLGPSSVSLGAPSPCLGPLGPCAVSVGGGRESLGRGHPLPVLGVTGTLGTRVR